MNKVELKVKKVEETIELGNILATICKPNTFIALNGDLGAGKTTFTKGIGQALEIKAVINSPTFTIMKVYNSNNHLNGIDKLYHLDVYRLQDSSDDFELEEYFYLDGLVVVEWCDIIKDLIPDDFIKIDFKIVEDETRLLTIESFGETDKIIDELKLKLEEKEYEIICR